AEFPPSAIEFFEKEVRPLFVAKCSKCHGAEKAESDFVLTSRAAVLRGGSRGAAVAPGDPDASLLIKAVRYSVEDLKMPPDGKLSAAEQEVLVRWVKMNAPWPDEGPSTSGSSGGAVGSWTDERIAELRARHWSFRPVAVIAPPRLAKFGSWSRSASDQFLAAEYEASGLVPAHDVDRRTLLRRATFDLTGLPPAPEEMREFIADESPDAFARVVDRLLASPRHGERYARRWLDVARYADSSGKDENHACSNAFRYRDYVVRSLNVDKPFDRFIVEQIAGDLLPASSDSERFEQLTATGFLQLGPKALAEQDKKKLLLDIADEQLDAIGRGVLGLTLGCARCHDHKFDPIGVTDYYSLAGILHSTRTMADLSFVSTWLERPLANQQTLDAIADHAKRTAENQKQLDALNQTASARVVANWKSQRAAYLLAACEAIEQKIGGDAKRLNEFAEQRQLDHELFTRLTKRILEAWPDAPSPASLSAPATAPKTAPSTSPSTAGNGAGAGNTSPAVAALAPVNPAIADNPLAPLAVVAKLPRDQFAARAIEMLKQWRDAKRTQPAAERIVRALDDAALATLNTRESLVERYEQLFAAVDSAWSAAQNPPPGQPKFDKLADAGDEGLRQLLYGPQGLLAPPAKPRDLFIKDELDALARIETDKAQLVRTQPAPVATAMAVDEGDVADLRINLRGNHLNLGAVAPRGFPRLVRTSHAAPVPATSSGRRELADWLVAPDQPLTPRVIVNRVWQWHFGRGLCRSPDNFGLRGEQPDHPELLDHLTSRFVRGGWSLKSLHRELVLSAAYRLDSHPSELAARTDPDNRRLSHFHRRRLEAEELRDALLATSGQLDLTIGGNLFNYANRESHVTYYKGPVNYDFQRRTLYLPVVRSAMLDVLELFDHGAALTPQSVRDETTVAPQALYLMNSPLVLNAAEQLAARVAVSSDGRERARRIYWELFQREPAEVEVARAVEFVERIEGLGRTGRLERGKSNGAGWAALTQALLFSNEFIYVD
ncbi:MAG TPA: DUF1553 domain-containing protein, partial [Pirellulaceae bacterium]|nr:DUF1553 domain-containing protein [Pirellulaceae bacterium]